MAGGGSFDLIRSITSCDRDGLPRTPTHTRTLVAAPFSMSWSLHFSEERPRVALLVSKESHCLYDILSRHEAGELRMDVPLIIGNHERLRSAAERFNIPFHHVPIGDEALAHGASTP